MAARDFCSGGSDRLRSQAAFGQELQLVGELQRTNDLSLPFFTQTHTHIHTQIQIK